MAQHLKLANISSEVLDSLKKFRFRKNATLTAILLKINKDTLTVELEEEWADTTFEEIKEAIPHQQPRYFAFSYPLKHDDGRLSYPLGFVYLSPQGCKPELQMMYAGTKSSLVNSAGFTKVFEYRNIEDITEEEIEAQLKKRF